MASSIATLLKQPGLRHRRLTIIKSISTESISIHHLKLTKIQVNTKNGPAKPSPSNIRSWTLAGRNRKKMIPNEWPRCRQAGWTTATRSTGLSTSRVLPTPTKILDSDHGSRTQRLGLRTSSSWSTPQGLWSFMDGWNWRRMRLSGSCERSLPTTTHLLLSLTLRPTIGAKH